MKPRLLYYEIIKQIKHKNALIITGMRQVGKTTLMKQIFNELDEANRLWFDFDNPLDQKLFEDEEYKNIYARLLKMVNQQSKKLYVFIDEIQNFPEITKIIKYLIDHYSVKFIVTGSSNFYLKNLFPESLSGRKFLYNLAPLNFREYLYFHDKLSLAEARLDKIEEVIAGQNIYSHKKFEPDYDDYLLFGGFPEVAVTPDAETKSLVLKNIFASFFEKDLKILSDYKDIRELRDLILLLAPRVGSMLEVSKLSSELGIDRPKVYSYLEFLQGMFFIKLLPKYSKSIDRSVAGGRKVYFLDNGILNIVSRVNDAQLLENSVINQLAHYGRVSFYSKRNTAEIDAIIGGKFALEIKHKGTEADLKKLKNIAGKLKIKKQYIISKVFVEKAGFISPVIL